MRERVSTYTGKSVEITYDRDRCIHAAECTRGSAALFDVANEPWCSPDAVDLETAMKVVARCPSGALTARTLAGATRTDAPLTEEMTVVQVVPDGPLYASGAVAVAGAAPVARTALCRCGASKTKPYCDGSHVKAEFKDAGPIDADATEATLEPGPLNVTLIADGPLIAEGPLCLRAASGRDAMRGRRAALCRCGASKNKPFCDGSHAAAGFKAEGV